MDIVSPSPITPIAPPVNSGKPSCGYTLVIVLSTVFITLLIEALVIFAGVTWGVNHFWGAIKNNTTFTTSGASSATGTKVPTGTAGSSSLVLTADQKQLLAKLGLKPEDLPADLNVQQIACVQTAIGNDRIQAIITGKASPGFGDLFKAKGCL